MSQRGRKICLNSPEIIRYKWSCNQGQVSIDSEEFIKGRGNRTHSEQLMERRHHLHPPSRPTGGGSESCKSRSMNHQLRQACQQYLGDPALTADQTWMCRRCPHWARQWRRRAAPKNPFSLHISSFKKCHLKISQLPWHRYFSAISFIPWWLEETWRGK